MMVPGACLDPRDPDGPREACPLMRSKRADIHDGPEHNTLQREAGYIDVRQQSRLDEDLWRRTAGPYIWVILNLHARRPLTAAYPLTASTPGQSR
jgi:hypothetical protein